jgi:hypothetical protein
MKTASSWAFPRIRLSWVLLAGMVWLLYKCFSRETLRVNISRPERDTTWQYEVFRYSNIYDLNCYMLVEGELDDTALVYSECLIPIEEKRRGKPDSQYVVRLEGRQALPKGKFKLYEVSEYSNPVTYRYVPHKARRGKVQFTFAKGVFNPDST